MSLCARYHTPCPSGYLQWHAWAEKKSRTHDQSACPHCGLFAIWRKRTGACVSLPGGDT